MTVARREFLWVTGCAAVTSTGIIADLLAPRAAYGALPPETFFARSQADAIRSVLGTSEASIDDQVQLVVPGLVEVADYVPVSVETALDGVESITIVADENPNPLVANFRLDPLLVPYVATRVRLAKAGKLHALVKAGGVVHGASKDVAVTIGGCGDPEEAQRSEAKIPPNNILMRVRKGDDAVVVRALITHPMTPPTSQDAEGGTDMSGRFIHEVSAQLNDRTVLRGDWSAGVSQNPYLSFKIREAQAGDTIRLTWTDNREMTRSSEVKVG